jgi:Glycosyltransferase
MQSTSALWKKFLQLHSEKPFDVVDTPELLAEGLIPAVTRCAPLLIRLYSPHSKFIAERFHNVTPSFDHLFVATLERVAMLSADVLTSPSDDLAEYVSGDLNYPRENIKIVYNPIDPKEFSPEGTVALPSDGRLTVLFVGRLEGRKGIKYLIDAVPETVAAYPNVRIVVLGDDTNNGEGQRSVKAELEKSLKEHGCSKHVEFVDRVPLSELAAYYRSADICIVPSLYDNSPYSCLEAMSCGKPVIGTSSGGTREYIVDGESGIIIPPRDSKAISEALVSLLTNQEERERLGRNARTRVMEKFQRLEIARQTAELYESACRHFVTHRQSRLYLKDSSQALQDANELMYAFDKMLGDFLYQYSWRARMRHWLELVKHRPRLLVAKVLVRASKVAARITGRQPGWVGRLQKEIESRQAVRWDDELQAVGSDNNEKNK